MKAATLALFLLAGCATSGRHDDASPPVGHADRVLHGAAPLAAPPPDVGNAEDPKTS
jgi:hypothetical protein